MRNTYRSTRLLLAAALTLCAGDAYADIQPTAATNGVGFDSPAAGVTNITAPDNAIIDYARFNVGAGETVNFIQPGASARVLNRIHGSTPSQINGNINANGIVYFVNPAGVQFGPNSIVNAAGIYAAASSLSNSDFLGGIDRFTNIAGDVTQRGVLRADTIAALIGKNVNNTGTISVPNGTVVLASGDEVMLGSPRGGLMVNVSVTPRADGEGTVSQNGKVEAEQVSLAIGDLASLAMASSNASNTSASTPQLTIPEIDTDGDGDIDNDDINTAYANFTGPLQPGTGGKTQQQGDTDGDGDVDNTDIATLFIYFTGPITPPEVADDFSLRVVEDFELTPITEEVNLSEADLGILRDQLGINPREASPKERVEKAQARALYNDTRAQAEAPAGDAVAIANSRLDADVVREALSLYRERILVDGVEPSERSAQIRVAVDKAYKDFSASDRFTPSGFTDYLKVNNPQLLSNLNAIDQLRRMANNMGLNDREKARSERTIIDQTRPAGLSYEQMKATLETAGKVSLAPVETESTAG